MFVCVGHRGTWFTEHQLCQSRGSILSGCQYYGDFTGTSVYWTQGISNTCVYISASGSPLVSCTSNWYESKSQAENLTKISQETHNIFIKSNLGKSWQDL